MNFKKIFPYILLAVLAITAITIRNCISSNTSTKKKTTTNEEATYTQRGLNRNPSNINYSKHAKCRMDCRKIDEVEIKDILKNGTINYKKSELQGADCKKKYVVEGISKDDQKLRIVFAPCGSEITVVTCIDLNKEWECSCEGDEKK